MDNTPPSDGKAGTTSEKPRSLKLDDANPFLKWADSKTSFSYLCTSLTPSNQKDKEKDETFPNAAIDWSILANLSPNSDSMLEFNGFRTDGQDDDNSTKEELSFEFKESSSDDGLMTSEEIDQYLASLNLESETKFTSSIVLKPGVIFASKLNFSAVDSHAGDICVPKFQVGKFLPVLQVDRCSRPQLEDGGFSPKLRRKQRDNRKYVPFKRISKPSRRNKFAQFENVTNELFSIGIQEYDRDDYDMTTNALGERKNVRRLRPILIDGFNVAFEYGKLRRLNFGGVEVTLAYFRDRGHKDIRIFLPRMKFSRHNKETLRIITKYNSITVFTADLPFHPDYSSTLIEEAIQKDGILVSNDAYRRSKQYHKAIARRRLPFLFSGKKFVPFMFFPTPNAKGIDDFLSFPVC